jgi:hypothetical protein
MKLVLAALAAALVALVALGTPAYACAVAPPDLAARIQIVDEEALVIWDPATKTEHFIRRAQFSGDAKAFGFIVPTPTPPKLEELDAELFAIMVDSTSPEVKHVTNRPWQLGSWLFDSCMMTTGGDQIPAGEPVYMGVRVLSTANVAGYDATSLQADDPTALASWLGAHGFIATPGLTEWLRTYVENKWTLTAFVVAGTPTSREDITTRAVDMTFTTDKPFYPYREPDGVSGSSRSLRVYFAAPGRYAATLASQPWSAKVTYAAPFDGAPGIGSLLGMSNYLTAFVDESTPRNGVDELYFAPASGPDVKPPPFVVTETEPRTIPVDMILIVGIFGFWIVRRFRRLRRRLREG